MVLLLETDEGYFSKYRSMWPHLAVEDCVSKMMQTKHGEKKFSSQSSVLNNTAEKSCHEDICRQATSKALTVGLSSIEIFRNKITKKVKLLDVKVSFSYQENYSTETIRLERQLVRHGNRWIWSAEPGQKTLVSFPYIPGDRVNLNIGIIFHKTKKHGLFGKETITSEAGTATECIVLAKNNGVGMGLPPNGSISQNMKLNFNLNGYGHNITVKVKLNIERETKGPAILFLRPCSSDKRFRNPNSVLEVLQGELPPKDRDEDVRHKMYIYNHQRLVNYQKLPVLECWSVRAAVYDSEIPAGIMVRQVLGGQTLAYMIPVAKPLDQTHSRYRLAILVITDMGPYCLCSAKWKSADKFDFKVHLFKSGETLGQRIKWASRDFLDIHFSVLNSTGHQITLRPDRHSVVEDICVGLCLKFLVRWSNELLPWKREDAKPMTEVAKLLKVQCSHHQDSRFSLRGLSSDVTDIENHMDNLCIFLESQALIPFYTVQEAMCADRDDSAELSPIYRSSSSSTHSSFAECKLRSKGQYDLNVEESDGEEDNDDDDENDTQTVGSKPKCDIEWDDLTSGFVDGRSEFTAGSIVDSVL